MDYISKCNTIFVNGIDDKMVIKRLLKYVVMIDLKLECSALVKLKVVMHLMGYFLSSTSFY